MSTKCSVWESGSRSCYLENLFRRKCDLNVKIKEKFLPSFCSLSGMIFECKMRDLDLEMDPSLWSAVIISHFYENCGKNFNHLHIY